MRTVFLHVMRKRKPRTLFEGTAVVPRLSKRTRVHAARDRSRVGTRARGARARIRAQASRADGHRPLHGRRLRCGPARAPYACVRRRRARLQGPRRFDRLASQQHLAGAPVARQTHFDSHCADPVLSQSATDIAARGAEKLRGILDALRCIYYSWISISQ